MFAPPEKFLTTSEDGNPIVTAMAVLRAYVPSSALLRALLRPQTPQCRAARPLAAMCMRCKSSTAANSIDYNLKRATHELQQKLRDAKSDFKNESIVQPDELLNEPDLPTISWYEQDADRRGPERLISRIATPEDHRKQHELAKMMEEDLTNPDYDDAPLKRRLLDDLMSNPKFADLTEEIESLKSDIMTREELDALEGNIRKSPPRWVKEMATSWNISMYQSIKELANDPELGDVRADLEHLLEKYPNAEDAEDTEFEAAARVVEEKLANSEAFQRKLAARQKQQGSDSISSERLLAIEKKLESLKSLESPNEEEDEFSPDAAEKLNNLLIQMKELLDYMGGDKKLQVEIDELLHEDPLAEHSEDAEEDIALNNLSQELLKLASQSTAAAGMPITEDNDVVDPELEAKVDKIMQDPKLIEKLMHVKEALKKKNIVSNNFTSISHESAPDPLTLEPSRTTSLAEQMKLAKSDPEHLAALGRLRVNLPPPFSVSPALKSFNQAIELSYVGANDDVRRILWRAYSKARTLPTFLQNLSDDAWDLLYYSQAVTWGSNQNRQQHLQLLLDDLQRVGKNGPPTHPSSLAQS